MNWSIKSIKAFCIALKYIEGFLILAATINGCISIFAFASLFVVPKEITSSAIGLKTCTITSGIKKVSVNN